MLVTCPECGARYEVEEALIPPEGRSVQCSACDHVWTAARPILLTRPAQPEAVEPRPAEREAGPPIASEPLSEEFVPPRTAAPFAPPEPVREEVALAAPPPLRDEVKAILREEAERDARLRREHSRPGTRPEPVQAAGPRPNPSAQPAGRRSGPLPDPDAINATLRPSSLRATAEQERRPRSGGGFWTGLMLGLCLVGLAAGTYAAAGRIASAVPAAAPVMEDYVESVEIARTKLDAAFARATAAVADLTGR